MTDHIKLINRLQIAQSKEVCAPDAPKCPHGMRYKKASKEDQTTHEDKCQLIELFAKPAVPFPNIKYFCFYYKAIKNALSIIDKRTGFVSFLKRMTELSQEDIENYFLGETDEEGNLVRKSFEVYISRWRPQTTGQREQSPAKFISLFVLKRLKSLYQRHQAFPIHYYDILGSISKEGDNEDIIFTKGIEPNLGLELSDISTESDNRNYIFDPYKTHFYAEKRLMERELILGISIVKEESFRDKDVLTARQIIYRQQQTGEPAEPLLDKYLKNYKRFYAIKFLKKERENLKTRKLFETALKTPTTPLFPTLYRSKRMDDICDSVKTREINSKKFVEMVNSLKISRKLPFSLKQKILKDIVRNYADNRKVLEQNANPDATQKPKHAFQQKGAPPLLFTTSIKGTPLRINSVNYFSEEIFFPLSYEYLKKHLKEPKVVELSELAQRVNIDPLAPLKAPNSVIWDSALKDYVVVSQEDKEAEIQRRRRANQFEKEQRKRKYKDVELQFLKESEKVDEL